MYRGMETKVRAFMASAPRFALHFGDRVDIGNTISSKRWSILIRQCNFGFPGSLTRGAGRSYIEDCSSICALRPPGVVPKHLLPSSCHLGDNGTVKEKLAKRGRLKNFSRDRVHVVMG